MKSIDVQAGDQATSAPASEAGSSRSRASTNHPLADDTEDDLRAHPDPPLPAVIEAASPTAPAAAAEGRQTDRSSSEAAESGADLLPPSSQPFVSKPTEFSADAATAEGRSGPQHVDSEVGDIQPPAGMQPPASSEPPAGIQPFPPVQLTANQPTDASADATAAVDVSAYQTPDTESPDHYASAPPAPSAPEAAAAAAAAAKRRAGNPQPPPLPMPAGNHVLPAVNGSDPSAAAVDKGGPSTQVSEGAAGAYSEGTGNLSEASGQPQQPQRAQHDEAARGERRDGDERAAAQVQDVATRRDTYDVVQDWR